MESESNDNDKSRKLSHITGTFVIDAMPSFLNGAGISKAREDKNYTILKTFADGIGESTEAEGGPRKVRRYQTVFVSSQSYRRMWRDTIIEETGWDPSITRGFKQDKDGHTSKISTERDPVSYVEDDAFGYMYTSEGSSKPVKVQTPEGTQDRVLESADEDEEQVDSGNNSSGKTQETAITTPPPTAAKKQQRVKTLARASPLSTSILVGLRKDGWQGRDEAFVHLLEGTPLPYSIQFANTPFQGIFSLNFSRLCKYSNVGDRIELDEELVKKYLASNTIKLAHDKPEYYSLPSITVSEKGKDKKKFLPPKKEHGNVYELVNTSKVRKERAAAIIKSLAVLRGGAKQAAFGTDVSPKVLIMAGLTCGNPVFNTIFEDDNSSPNRGKTVSINIKALKEIVKDYQDRICTPIFVGIRAGFLKNEEDVLQSLTRQDGFIVTTPIDAAHQMCGELPAVS